MNSEQANHSNWSDFGTITESIELEYLSPIHHYYPAWPGGERWLHLLKSNRNTEIIYTEGLSLKGSPHQFEIYLETDEEVEDFGSSWQASLVYEIGRILPKLEDPGKLFSEYRFVTIQLDIDGAPDDWSLDNPDGNIGMFLSLETNEPETSKFHFIPINIRLMRPREMQYVLDNGAEGRIRIADLYKQQGNPQISNLDRKSVI